LAAHLASHTIVAHRYDLSGNRAGGAERPRKMRAVLLARGLTVGAVGLWYSARAPAFGRPGA